MDNDDQYVCVDETADGNGNQERKFVRVTC